MRTCDSCQYVMQDDPWRQYECINNDDFDIQRTTDPHSDAANSTVSPEQARQEKPFDPESSAVTSALPDDSCYQAADDDAASDDAAVDGAMSQSASLPARPNADVAKALPSKQQGQQFHTHTCRLPKPKSGTQSKLKCW